MAKRKLVRDFKIDNAAALGDTQLVAAPGAGFFIRVLGYTLVSGGATNVTFRSAATAKTGPMPLAAQTVVSPEPGGADTGARQFDCAANEALVLNSSAAIQVSGHGTHQILKVGTVD